MKHQVNEIKLTGGEGKPEWYGRTFSSWDAFEHYIYGLRAKLPKDMLGIIKADATVVFDDGKEYYARWGFKPTTKEHETLRAHIRTFAQFYTGHHCPRHLTTEQYASLMARYSPEEKQSYADFLANYEV
jgi:hypothetical protein